MLEARSDLRGAFGWAAWAARTARPLARPWGIPEVHAAQRSSQSVFGFFALVLFFVAVTFVPAVASLLAVQRGTAISVALAWLGCSSAATAAYHRQGLSRLYRLLDAFESLSIQMGVCLFLYRSGSALSIFWLAYLGHVQMIAALGFCAQNLAVIATGPCAWALCFWLDGDPASALVGVLIGAMGMLVYSTMARMHSALDVARAREAQLKSSLARFRVAEERSRIARDLHDGIGGELAALAWRLRQFPVAPEPTTLDGSEREASDLEGRIRNVLANLRRVVLDLRQEPRSWVDLLAALRERCHDLCGDRELKFSVSGALEAPPAQRIADDVQCIVSELVRNAIRHANPRSVEVRIRIRDGVELSVTDDGTGLDPDDAIHSSGGLANVRTRVTRLGGELAIGVLGQGTHVEIRLPPVDD